MGKREVNKRQSVAEMGNEPGSSDSGAAPTGHRCPRDLPAAGKPLWKEVRSCVDKQDLSRDCITQLGAWDEVFFFLGIPAHSLGSPPQNDRGRAARRTEHAD